MRQIISPLKIFLLPWLLFLTATIALAQTVFVDFNLAGQYTDNFNVWNDNGGGNGGAFAFSENAGDGMGNGGGVNVFQSTDTTATYKTGSWNFATNGSTIILSAMLYANGGNNGDKIQLGAINSSANGLNGNAGIAFESFRLIPDSTTAWGVYEQSRAGNTTGNSAELGSVTVIAGHWYKFVVGMTNTSGATGNLSASCALYDYSTSGLTPGANLITFSTLQTHAAQDIATNPSVWTALRITANAAVNAWDNFLVYQSNSLPTMTWNLTNSVAALGNPATFNALADGPGAISYAWYTNKILAAGVTSAVYTTPPLGSGFTNLAVVAKNANGSVTNSATITVVAPSLPQMSNASATGIAATYATLNGQVVSTGGANTGVILFYGPNDGGANAASWANSISLGTQNGSYSQTISGLSPSTTYYFTAEATNSVGAYWATPSQTFATSITNPVSSAVAVLTYHNDNTRMGVNANETILTPANVNTNSFGKLFSHTVDGFVYAEPLIMTNVNIPGKGTHNIVIVATEHNSVYAFDADNNSGANAAPLWQTSFINAAAGITTVPNGDVGTTDITPEVGVTSTPVIDPVTGTIYFEVKTKEPGPVYVHRLHALDITTGLERTNFNSPSIISCTNYIGNGNGDNDGKNPAHVLWNPLREHSRPALTLLNGVVYMSFASHGDNQPYHGWFFGYNATNVAQQVSVFNATPNGAEGGFWDSGGGPSVDAQGNMYFQTGNGTFDGGTTISPASDYSMSLLKFSTTNGLSLVDYFAPSNAVNLSNGDQDLGSAAPIILPDSVGSIAHPHLVIGGGKTAPIYVVDRDNMGRFNGTTGTNKIVQQFNGGPAGDRDTAPAFFNNALYTIDGNGRIGAYKIANGLFNTTPVETPDTYDNKGGATASISANGTNNGIAWVIYNSGGTSPATPCVLRAYNATNLTQKLYSSDQIASRDSAGNAVKFTTPTIANGKVYVGAQYTLTVYGLATSFVSTPTISPNGGIFTNSVTVTLADATAGATIYYTLDGTAPTTNSILYSIPFTLTNSVSVTASAFKNGSVPSGSASASFINSSSVGNGVGLLGKYFANTTSGAFITPGFNAAPTLTRIDSTINFDWSTTSPATNVGPNTYVVRWTGSVEPQFNDTYTFYATADDGVRLWVNGQLLVDEWVDEGTTTWSGSIALKAQQRYNIEMDYYQNGGGAVAQLAWSSPLMGPMTIIPQSQLYPLTNPPPSVVLTSPNSGANYTASATVTVSANAAAQYNNLNYVQFFANNTLLGTVTDVPYTLTATGLAAGNYSITAVAVDGSGLSSTSAPINITVNAGSGLAYGLTNLVPTPAFFSMPQLFDGISFGSIPAHLSLTGVFTNTPNMTPYAGLIPYVPNTPLWSDGAAKIRYLSIPNSGAPLTADEQINFAPTGTWTFPSGTIFVKTFLLQTNQSDPNSLHRLETRLLVRDINGAVYGVTYKWRADGSDADLLTASSNENIAITTPSGVITQTWYYPSPADCLTCHTPVANYVLGVNSRQLNGSQTYPSGVTDNQLRTLNRVGLLNPAFNEANITNFEKLYAVTNPSASLELRVRSYLDANCAQCHQPGGSGPTIDARFDTPLTNQNLIYGVLNKGNLGYDNAYVIVPHDVWRSVLYDRINTLDNTIKMPPLARNLIDSNAVAVFAQWINSLPGTPALPPPAINPNGGTFNGSVTVNLLPPDGSATLYYTLDGSLPTTSSFPYTGPFVLTTNATVSANAFENGFANSVAANASFTILPGVYFTGANVLNNNTFQLNLAGLAGTSYILQASTNLTTWVNLSTNMPTTDVFSLMDTNTSQFNYRFYRVIQNQ